MGSESFRHQSSQFSSHLLHVHTVHERSLTFLVIDRFVLPPNSFSFFLIRFRPGQCSSHRRKTKGTAITSRCGVLMFIFQSSVTAQRRPMSGETGVWLTVGTSVCPPCPHAWISCLISCFSCHSGPGLALALFYLF